MTTLTFLLYKPRRPNEHAFRQRPDLIPLLSSFYPGIREYGKKTIQIYSFDASISAIKSQRSAVWAKYESRSIFQATLSRAGDGQDLSDCLETKKSNWSCMLTGWLGRLPRLHPWPGWRWSRPWSWRLSEVRSLFFMLQRNNVSSANLAKSACSQSSAS